MAPKFLPEGLLEKTAANREALASVAGLERAKREGKGAISLRGKMIDAPIVARAERTIEMARALGIERRGQCE